LKHIEQKQICRKKLRYQIVSFYQYRSINNVTKYFPITEDFPKVCNTALVKDGYIKLINQWEWRWYFTLTFTDDVHPEHADKLFRRWIRKLCKFYFGNNYKKKNMNIDWVRSSEFQKRGTLHYHGLLNIAAEFDQFHAMKLWEDLDGKFREEGKTGMARIFKAEQPAAEIYITKYISKETNIDISEHLSTNSKKESKNNFKLS